MQTLLEEGCLIHKESVKKEFGGFVKGCVEAREDLLEMGLGLSVIGAECQPSETRVRLNKEWLQQTLLETMRALKYAADQFSNIEEWLSELIDEEARYRVEQYKQSQIKKD